MKMTTFCTNL